MTARAHVLATAELRARLRAHFAPPAYAVLEEVGDATGARQSRWADALVMSLWPSRGLTLTGIEIKASRSDWVRELQKPEKAEAICRYCDHWYVLVGDKGIVQPGELPPTWGLIAPHRSGLRIVTPAPALTPAAVSRGFLAAIFRRSVEQGVDADTIKKEREAAAAQERQRAEREHERTKEQLQGLKAVVDRFELASGVKIQEYWSPVEQIGEAVRMVMAGDAAVKRARVGLRRLHDDAKRVADAIARELGEVQP